MNVFQAAVLGLIQGLTEFLPVSSTAHLLIAQETMGVNEPGLHLEVAVHLGTAAAVVVYYRKLFVALARGAVRGGSDRALAGKVVLATLLLGIVGAVHHFAPAVKEWRDDVRIGAVGLICMGVFLLVTGFARRGSAETTTTGALWVGLAQCVSAIVPGWSRSGSTIGTGVLVGTDPRDAARFSFLLSVPAVLAGAGKDAVDALGQDAAASQTIAVLPLAVGAAVAFAAGMAAIQALLTIVGRGRLHWFGPYCIGVGVLVAAYFGG